MRSSLCIMAAALGLIAYQGSAQAQVVEPATPSSWVNWPSAPTDIDGRTGGITQRRRPWTAADDGSTLNIENMFVHDFVNNKAFHVSLSSDAPGGGLWTYDKVNIKHIEAARINRDEVTAPGLHMDFLIMDGRGLNSPRETEVNIEDVYFHDGDALTTLIKAGRYSAINIKKMRVENTTTPVQLGFVGDGYVRKIRIEDSPGLQVAVFGNAGAVGPIELINSPGAKVNFKAMDSIPGSSIIPASVTIPDAGSVVPEPVSIALLPIAGLLLAHRRRRALAAV